MSITNSEGKEITVERDGPFRAPANALSREVHLHDDVDFEQKSHHHTIGVGPNQAASGAEFKNLQATVDGLIVGGGSHFVGEQSFATPIAFWIMAHGQHTKGLGVYVQNTFGIPLEGDISYPDLDHVRVDFYWPMTGLMRIFN